MSLRSRLGPEIAFALNSLALLSSTTPGEFTFSLALFPDLLEEVLELFEDVVTGNTEEDDLEGPIASAMQSSLLHKSPSKGHAKHVATPVDTYSQATAVAVEREFSLRRTVQSAEPAQKLAGLDRAELALACIALLRNLAYVEEVNTRVPSNIKILSDDVRVLRMSLLAIQTVLQLRCMSHPPSNPLRLSETQVLQAKKDVIQLIGQLGQHVQLESHPSWVGQAIIELVDYFLDPSEVPNSQVESAPQANFFGPGLDAALVALSKLALTDPNRDALSKLPTATSIIRSFIFAKFTILLQLLPVSDLDFQFLTSEPSLMRMEIVAMCMFNLVYIATPDVRKKLREKPGVIKTLARVVRKLYGVHLTAGSGQPNSSNNQYLVFCQRCIEVLRVLSEDEAGGLAGARSTGSQEGIAWFGGSKESRDGEQGGQGSVRSRPSLSLCKTDFVE